MSVHILFEHIFLSVCGKVHVKLHVVCMYVCVHIHYMYVPYREVEVRRGKKIFEKSKTFEVEKS